MARSFNGNIPKVPIDADDSAARKKIDGIIKEIKNVPDIELDADVSQAKRRIEQAVSKNKINTQFLGDFLKVIGAIKSATSQNLPEDMYGNLIDSAEKFYSTFKNISTVIDGTTFSGLSTILNQVDDLGKISNIAVEDAKALEQSTEQIAKNEERRKEAQKQLNKIKDATRYREKESNKLSADLDSAESLEATIQKLSKHAEKVKELKTQLQGLSDVGDTGFQSSLSQVEAHLDDVFGSIEAKMESLKEQQAALANPKVQEADISGTEKQTEALRENTQAAEENAAAHEKVAKAKKSVAKPEILQNVDILEDREEIYYAKTVAQKKKAAEEMLREQWYIYQQMKKEYEDPENATELFGTDYESLLNQQNRLESYIALYEKYGGKVGKISKKFQEFSDNLGFTGSYQYNVDQYEAQLKAAEEVADVNEKVAASYEKVEQAKEDTSQQQEQTIDTGATERQITANEDLAESYDKVKTAKTEAATTQGQDTDISDTERQIADNEKLVSSYDELTSEIDAYLKRREHNNLVRKAQNEFYVDGGLNASDANTKTEAKQGMISYLDEIRKKKEEISQIDKNDTILYRQKNEELIQLQGALLGIYDRFSLGLDGSDKFLGKDLVNFIRQTEEELITLSKSGVKDFQYSLSKKLAETFNVDQLTVLNILDEIEEKGLPASAVIDKLKASVKELTSSTTQDKSADTSDTEKKIATNKELAESYEKVEEAKKESTSSEADGSTQEQVNNAQKVISSYEELCAKINEYIELKKKVVSLHDSGEDISQYAPQLRKLETDLTRGISDSLDLSSATMMLQSFPASIDERAMTNSLAQYLGIEIPTAAEKGKKSLEDFMSLFNELSAKSGDKNAFGQRYAYLLEGVSGENPAMDISAAYDELIQKEDAYQQSLKEQQRINAERAQQIQEFMRLSQDVLPNGAQSSEETEIFSELLNKISLEGLSASEAIEQLKTSLKGVEDVTIMQEQNENNQKVISSYEELCDAVKRYNLLLFEAARSGGFTEEEEKEFSSIVDLIQRSVKAQSNQNPFNYDGSIKSVEQLAQYLRIEIPASAEKAISAMEEFSESTKDDTNTQAVDELKAKLSTLGDEFKNSEQCTAIFDGLVESVKSGSKTVEQAIKELDTAFEQWNIEESFKEPEQAAENFKLTAKEMCAALDSIDLRGFFKSLNIEDSDIPQLTKAFLELIRLTKAAENGFNVDNAINNQFESIIDTLMRLGSIIQEDDGIYQTFADRMNGVKIAYTDFDKAEFGDDWKNIRRKFQRNLISASRGKGIAADVLYMELLDSFPGLFDSNIIAEQDQFREILNVLDRSKNGGKIKYNLPNSYRDNIGIELSQLWTKALNSSEVKDSSDSIESEADAMEKVEAKAGAAAKSKGKFTNANKQAGASAEESADSFKKEADAADDVNQAMSEPPDTSGWDKVIDKFSDEGRTDLISRTLSKKSINEDTLLSQTTVQKWAKDQDGQWQMASETVTASIEGLITKYNNEMKKFNSIQTDIFDMDQSKFTADFQNQINDYVDALNKFEEARNVLRNSRDDPNAMPAAVEGFNQAAQNVRNLGSEIEKTISNIKKFDSYGDVFQKISNVDPSDSVAEIRDKMESLAEEVTNTTFKVEGFDEANKVLTGTFTNEVGEIEKVTVALNEANNEISAFHKNTGQKAPTFFGQLKGLVTDGAKRIVSLYLDVNDFIRYISKGVQAVREIDLAMTELKKVTDETDESYANFLKNASKTASTIGATLNDFTTVTSDFARLGYSMEEASDLAKVALVYENVGDGFSSVSEASESIISTMKAFGIEATDTMEIVDKFNEVGNNFAITSKGIGDALQRSASSLYEAGNTLDESIGLITGMNSVVQDPEQVGTALKTLTMRLRGAKTELEDAGLDADNMASSTSKLREQLLALTGVDIMQDENTFKSTTQILREMSAVWEDLSDIDAAAALELMGGSVSLPQCTVMCIKVRI